MIWPSRASCKRIPELPGPSASQLGILRRRPVPLGFLLEGLDLRRSCSGSVLEGGDNRAIVADAPEGGLPPCIAGDESGGDPSKPASRVGLVALRFADVLRADRRTRQEIVADYHDRYRTSRPRTAKPEDSCRFEPIPPPVFKSPRLGVAVQAVARKGCSASSRCSEQRARRRPARPGARLGPVGAPGIEVGRRAIAHDPLGGWADYYMPPRPCRARCIPKRPPCAPRRTRDRGTKGDAHRRRFCNDWRPWRPRSLIRRSMRWHSRSSSLLRPSTSYRRAGSVT